jgi:hypothetical protein
MLAIVRDEVVAAGGAVVEALWTDVFVPLVLTHRLSSSASCKLVHVTTGPPFFLTLMLYSARPGARIFAAAGPAVFVVRLLLAAHGITVDGFTAAVARGEDGSGGERASWPA